MAESRTYNEPSRHPCLQCLLPEPTVKEDVDVILIGGGIMSATLGVMLLELEPTWKIHIYETLANAGEEASNG